MPLHDAFGILYMAEHFFWGVERAGTVWYFAAKPVAICGACLELLEELVAGFPHSDSSFCRFKPSKLSAAQNC